MCIFLYYCESRTINRFFYSKALGKALCKYCLTNSKLALELLTAVYEISAGAMRGLGYSLLPAVITCVGSCVIRLIWISTVCKVVHVFWVLMIIYPISWVITGIAMMTAYYIVRRKCFTFTH